jgi:hypothetical protein
MQVATQRLAQSAELALAARAHHKNPNTMQEYAMRTDKRTTLIARNDLLKLLTDDEVASVSTAETAGQLDDQDEYLDLSNLDKGVRRAKRGQTLTSSVLPKKAVSKETWNKIMAQLAPLRAAAVAARA